MAINTEGTVSSSIVGHNHVVTMLLLTVPSVLMAIVFKRKRTGAA